MLHKFLFTKIEKSMFIRRMFAFIDRCMDSNYRNMVDSVPYLIYNFKRNNFGKRYCMHIPFSFGEKSKKL